MDKRSERQHRQSAVSSERGLDVVTDEDLGCVIGGTYLSTHHTIPSPKYPLLTPAGYDLRFDEPYQPSQR